MSNINVSYLELENVSSSIGAGRETIFTELDRLKNVVDNLVSSGFVTEKASGAFSTAYNEFTSGARQTISGLDGVQKFLKAAQSTLQEVDANLAAQLN